MLTVTETRFRRAPWGRKKHLLPLPILSIVFLVTAMAAPGLLHMTVTIVDDGNLKFWQLPPLTPTLPKTLPGHTASIRALAMTADNTAFYTGGDDRTVRHFTLAGVKEVRALSSTGLLPPMVRISIRFD